MEAAEHLANTDGKVFTTLKQLFLHPAALTRAYLAGKRMAQVAPLQLFFVMLVLFLFVGEETINVEFVTPTAAQVAMMPGWARSLLAVSARIHAHGGNFLEMLRRSAEVFGLLMVPVAALLLWGLYAGQGRRLYDHLIFVLHSLSFQLVVVGVLLALPDSLGWLAYPLLVVMAAHLFVHLRGVYGGGVAGVLARMAVLGLGTAVAFAVLFAGWIGVAYVAMGA